MLLELQDNSDVLPIIPVNNRVYIIYNRSILLL